jgi:hypothetical protein
MKITIVTGPIGELVAVIHAHISEHDRNKTYENGPHASLRPAPGQNFHEVVAPELAASELRNWVIGHIKDTLVPNG